MKVNMNGVRNKVINTLLAVLLELTIAYGMTLITLITGLIIHWVNEEWLVANLNWIWSGLLLLVGLPMMVAVLGMNDSKMYLGDKPKVYWAKVKQKMKESVRKCLRNWPISLVSLPVSLWFGNQATEELCVWFNELLEANHGMVGNGIFMSIINALVCIIFLIDGVLLAELSSGAVIYGLAHFFGWIKTPGE